MRRFTMIFVCLAFVAATLLSCGPGHEYCFFLKHVISPFMGLSVMLLLA